MNRIPFIAGNWKMYKTGPEAVETAKKLASLCSDVENIEVMIAPTFLSLPLVASCLMGTRVKTGAQNLYFEKEGAFTGEVSAEMIRAAGSEYVIIGHSERRQYFGETDISVCKKLGAAIYSGLKPVFCIGETEAERDEEKTFQTLDKQVSDGLKGFGSDELKDLILAYEPVWAIGTGRTATPQQAQEVHRLVRNLLAEMYDSQLAQETRILYGGSVKSDNSADLMGQPDIDGLLVGGASLNADDFLAIIQSAA